MEKRAQSMSSFSNSRTPMESSIVIRNNALMVNKEDHVQELKRLSSRIICSDNITRQNLNKKTSTSNNILTADDDEQFFNRMKSEVDKGLSLRSKERREPCLNYQTALSKSKKRIIDAETQNVMKRFKSDVKHINFKHSLNNTSITQLNNNNVFKETHYDEATDVNQGNIMHYQNLFSSNILDKKSRNPPNKCIFQITSKLQKNVVPLATKETTIIHEEYEESLFYGLMLLTPPNSNSVDNNEDS